MAYRQYEIGCLVCPSDHTTCFWIHRWGINCKESMGLRKVSHNEGSLSDGGNSGEEDSGVGDKRSEG